MSDPTPIREPGVDVVQAVRSTPPAVSSPTLVPVVVGPCKKVLEVTETDGSLNEEARIQLPALYQPHYYLVGIDPDGAINVASDEVLALEINSGPSSSLTFKTGSWTLKGFVAYVNAQAATLGLSVVADEVIVGTDKSLPRIRTTTKGELAALKATWTSATVDLADGLRLPRVWDAVGYDQYSNDRLLVTQDLLPDPWNLRPDLDLLESTVRGFLTSATAVKKELFPTTAVTRSAQSWLKMSDDGDGDGSTPLVLFKASAGAQLAKPTDIEPMATVAQDDNLPAFDEAPTEGMLVNTTVPNWGPGVIKTACRAGTTGALPACTYAVGPPATLTCDTNTVLPAQDGVTLVVSDRLLVKNQVADLQNGVYEVTSIGVVGVSPWILTRVSDMDADAEFPAALVNVTEGVTLIGTYWLCTVPGGFVLGDPVTWGRTYISLDFWVQVAGWPAQQIQVTGATSHAVTQAEVLAAINDRFPRYAPDTAIAIDDPGTFGAVRIRSFRYGREGTVRVWGTHAVYLFGAGTYPKAFRGNYQQVRVGDEIWVDGSLCGVVSQILAPGVAGASDAKVRLDREYALDYFDDPATGNPTKHTWWIVSKSLAGQLDADTGIVTASPELYVTEYLIQFRHDTLRGNIAQPLYPTMNAVVGKAYLPVFFEALRLDVTAKATTRDVGPVVIRGNDFDGLETQFSPLDAQNPLGLAGYFSLLNSDIVPIALLGIDEVSDDYPEGTPEAYARAFAVLKSYRNTYPISVLSREIEVGLALWTHVTYMSRTKLKGERLGFFTADIPTRDEPTTVGSGTKGNAAEPGAYPATETFETNLIDLGDLFLAAGVTDTTFDASGSDGVYLNIEGDTKNYMVLSYSGTTVTCTPAYAGGALTDSFWAVDGVGQGTLWSAVVIDKTFSIGVRGGLLVDTAGLPDKTAIARAIGRRAARFKTRRMLCGAPGWCEATIDGLAQRIPTYYLAAATMAQRCAMHPAKPQSKSPIVGFTKVFDANGYFDDEDMDLAAGYGVWWWKNDEATGAVLTRMQLTTDPTSVKTRELSMTVALDYGTKTIRVAVEPMTGTISLNENAVQQITIIVQGVLDFLTKGTQVWKNAHDPKVTIGPFKATADDLAEGLGDGDLDEILIELDAELAPPFNRARIRIVA